ncbi:MAG: low-specificity L-threonine aldolase [bacterium]|nr:low-specificity L-threonine aldolase [bacterium]
MSTIDLRSDTVTRPNTEMLEAMMGAEVGDDVYGEDPTINRLQAMAAERLGKEAALFVPSGSMANQIALRAHTEPGDAVIAGQDVHMFLYESGAAAAISGVQFNLVGEDGIFGADDVRFGIHPGDDHFPRTRLVCVENTHNRSGGRVFPPDNLKGITQMAREAGLGTHLDGARIFNAEVASGIPAAVLAEGFDSVSFCLSKGLGAPVGSLLVASNELIERAHRFRKMLGGGLRQAGYLAAAGIFSLENNVKRLAEDHANARRLADGLRTIPGVCLHAEPETNMVLFGCEDILGLCVRLREKSVLINPISFEALRAVTHLDVSAEEIDRAIEAIGTSL